MLPSCSLRAPSFSLRDPDICCELFEAGQPGLRLVLRRATAEHVAHGCKPTPSHLSMLWVLPVVLPVLHVMLPEVLPEVLPVLLPVVLPVVLPTVSPVVLPVVLPVMLSILLLATFPDGACYT